MPIFKQREYDDFDARPSFDKAWGRLPIVRRIAGLRVRWLGPLVNLGHDRWIGELSGAAWGTLEGCGWQAAMDGAGEMVDKRGRVRPKWAAAVVPTRTVTAAPETMTPQRATEPRPPATTRAPTGATPTEATPTTASPTTAIPATPATPATAGPTRKSTPWCARKSRAATATVTWATATSVTPPTTRAAALPRSSGPGATGETRPTPTSGRSTCMTGWTTAATV